MTNELQPVLSHTVWPSELTKLIEPSLSCLPEPAASQRRTEGYGCSAGLTFVKAICRFPEASLTSMALEVKHKAPFFELKDLRYLEIDMRNSMDSDGTRVFQSEQRYVTPWMTRLNTLETFKLIQDPLLNPGIDVLEFLCEMEWPKLQHLHLRHVSSKLRCLEKFIDGHASTLRTLRIIKPTMPMQL